MSRKKKGGSGEGGGAPEWMTTYSDLVTLLLTFFILLFSMAVLDAQKFEEVSFALRSTLLHNANGEKLMTNKGQSAITINNVNPDDTGEKKVDNKKYIETAEEMIIDAEEKLTAEKLSKARTEMEELINNLGIQDYVEIIEEKEFLMIRMESQVFFNSGSAEVKKDGQEVLDGLCEYLRPLDNDIHIQGHTDNVPINTPEFPSNWELSTKRATNVVIYMVDYAEMNPSKLTATGNGEFKSIADNSTAEGRQKNRRIEITIIK